MEPSRQTGSSYGPRYPLGCWSSDCSPSERFFWTRCVSVCVCSVDNSVFISYPNSDFGSDSAWFRFHFRTRFRFRLQFWFQYCLLRICFAFLFLFPLSCFIARVYFHVHFALGFCVPCCFPLRFPSPPSFPYTVAFPFLFPLLGQFLLFVLFRSRLSHFWFSLPIHRSSR